jgi:hypothetical protein
MKDLIAALQIFAKYTDADAPTHCEHDVLLVAVQADAVSPEDTAELDRLGFFVSSDPDNDGCFISFRFGSC